MATGGLKVMGTAEEKMDVDLPNGKTDAEKKKSNSSAASANAHFRVKISGLPRFYTPTDPLLLAFKKMLHDEMGLTFKYIRSPKKGNSWLYITFFNQTMQEKALKLLRNYVWQGRSLICTLVVADVLKRKQDDGDEAAAKKPRLDIPIEEQMLMATIPYHSISYQEQLSKKNEEATCLFKWLAECMEKKTPELIGYIDQEVAKNVKTRLPFKLDDVRASPVIDGYRNKCEFRIGSDPDSKKIVIGYRVDNQEDDLISVAPPDSLRHLPKQMIDIVKGFEKYVQESEFKPQLVNHDTGVWRLLHVRVNKLGQVMVVVMINPTVLAPEQLTWLKQDLIRFFTSGPAKEYNIVSLYLHSDNDIKIVSGTLGGDKSKRPQGQLELLWGAERMEEQLLEFSMDIDPNFYFQNNTHGAEVLYKAILELGNVDMETTVLDLCCGSGGMGMMFAPHCKQVIGVEVMDVNVDDAKRLATKNGLTNCDFLQGAVDDLFPQIEERLKGQKVVAILDPPRTGISLKLIESLRKMKEVERIIYVCSNHKLPSKNIMDMAVLEGENKIFKGTSPFFPTRVIPVDISPHSLRCELAILLERLDLAKIPKPDRTPSKARIGSMLYKNTPRAGQRNSRGRSASRNLRGGRVGVQRGFPMRETFYPRPLRGAQPPLPTPMSMRRRFDDFAPPPPPRPLHRPHPYAPPPPRLDRYSVEDAMDEYQPRGRVSSTLAMANAMLERGLQLASEAMHEDDYAEEDMYPPPRRELMSGYIGMRGRGGLRGGPVPGVGGVRRPPPPAMLPPRPAPAAFRGKTFRGNTRDSQSWGNPREPPAWGNSRESSQSWGNTREPPAWGGRETNRSWGGGARDTQTWGNSRTNAAVYHDDWASDDFEFSSPMASPQLGRYGATGSFGTPKRVNYPQRGGQGKSQGYWGH